MARGGADDVFAVGPPEVVIPAVKRFQEEIKERCNLQLQWAKSEYYCREGHLPPGAPPGLTLAGVQLGDHFYRGMAVYGVPVGSDKFCLDFLRSKKDEIVKDALKTRELLAADRQALWTALRLSISQRFSYLQQHVPPSLCEHVARELDNELWKVFETACGFPVPRGEEGGGFVVKTPAVPCLDGRSFQEWVVRLPATKYGWGLRSLAETCGYAYLGMLETTVPFMSGEQGVCPALAVLWGGQECWGPAARKEERWRQALASGSKVGGELQKIWRRAQEEAEQAASWLGGEVPPVLAAQVEGIGGDTVDASVSGGTRGRVVQALESQRAKVEESSPKRIVCQNVYVLVNNKID